METANATAQSATDASSSPAIASQYPPPREGDWEARNFQFGAGEVFDRLRLHYTTIGEASGDPVVLLHGTAGSGGSFLNPGFAGELFGPGQPLDASRYFIILPDALGAGKSSKPSDGLRARFPRYDYDDMVQAQHRLLTEGLGVRHLRLVIGNSMGGMQTWIWGETYPDFIWARKAALPDLKSRRASAASARAGARCPCRGVRLRRKF